jgi:uncharacterized protein (TIGR03000 family)
MSNKALLATALCAMVLPASASAQVRTAGSRVVDRPLVVEGYQTRGPIVRGNMFGYYGTGTARRLNFYQLPRYHWYPDSVGYVNQWPYGEMTSVEVPRFTPTYPVAAEVYDPYYVGYYGTDTRLRLNFYAMPEYQWYPYNVGSPSEWTYGPVAPLEVARSYVLPAEVYEGYYASNGGYYASYGGTLMPTNGTVKPASLPSTTSQPSTKAPSTTASLKVYVPTSTAEVWLNGVKTTQTGLSRELVTPELTSGQNYEVRVQWMENGKSVTQTRTGQLRPGSQVVLAFSAE